MEDIDLAQCISQEILPHTDFNEYKLIDLEQWMRQRIFDETDENFSTYGTIDLTKCTKKKEIQLITDEINPICIKKLKSKPSLFCKALSARVKMDPKRKMKINKVLLILLSK